MPVEPTSAESTPEPVTSARPGLEAPHVEVAVIGTGFSGLGAGIALARAGIPYTILERAHDVGGTWRDNTYPGCRCDVPSHLYSFSFAPNPGWSETYSPQPEIWDYLRTTASDHGVLDHIRFGHELLEAQWDHESQRWALRTSSGPLTARFVMLGNGPLAEPAIPDIPGLDRFAGTAFHSARWRHDHDLTGKRVAVIGTGASAIQLVPEIADPAAHVAVFQRTPPWVLPHRNRRITAAERLLYRRLPALQRAVRALVYWSRELFVTTMLRNGRTLTRLEGLARRMIHDQIDDPDMRAAVTPDYRPGCKRLLLSNDWYPTLQRDDVDLITEKVVEVTPSAIVTADGVEHAADTIIFGTGFRVTDNPVIDRVRGREGESLAATWSTSGMQAYLGTTVPGFPNLFMLAGPNTGIGHTSLVVMIEAQLHHAVAAITETRDRGAGSIEVRRPVCDAYNREIQRKAARTVWNSGGCASWYLDAEGRNTTLWPDHSFRFVRRARRFRATDYELVAPPDLDLDQ